MTDKDYWAMFAAACIAGEGNTDNAAHFADRLLVEMKKRWPDPVPPVYEALYFGKPWSMLTEAEKEAFNVWKNRVV